MADDTGDVDLEEFRHEARRLVDWIADYLADPERYPVLSPLRPGAVRETIPAEPPAAAEALARILDDVPRAVLPGVTHWNHPGFFAYFPSSASAPGILGEMLAAALNVNGMLWKTSPAATEMEVAVLDWLRQMLGLPAGL